MNMIKQTLTKLPARETVHKIINEKGGIMKIESSGELPRDRTQVYNIAKGMKTDTTFNSLQRSVVESVGKGKGRTAGKN